MAVLIDTHVFFWWVTNSSRLRQAHRDIFDRRNEPIYVSAVTGWEIAIKVKLGKWPDAQSLVPGLTDLVGRSGLQMLDLTLVQAERAGLLDLSHRDPFDRLLAAQALDQDLTLLTVDPAFTAFGCRTE